MIKQGEFGGHWDDHLLGKRFPLHLECTRQQFFRDATYVLSIQVFEIYLLLQPVKWEQEGCRPAT